MKLINFFLFLLCFPVFCLMPIPASLEASTNAQPWGEQEAERDAQEEITSAERSAQEAMGSSIYGRITNMDLNAKILSLLPTDQVENKEEEEDDEVVSQDYHFRSDTALTGIDEFSELAPGDYVTLEYYTFRDKNRITEIAFARDEAKEGTSPKTKDPSPSVLVG